MNEIDNFLIFKTLMGQLQQKILWLSADLTILGCSDSSAKYLGLRNPMEIYGKTLSDVLDNQEDANKYTSMFKSVIDNNKPLYDRIDMCIGKDGYRTLIKFDIVPIRDSRDNPMGALIIINDITEKTYLEDKLNKNEEKYKSLIDFTNTAFCILNIDMKIIETNQAFVDMVGAKSVEETMGINPRTWVGGRDVEPFDNAFQSLIKDNKIINELEIAFVGANAKTTFSVINANIIENGQRKILCLLRDISYKRSIKNDQFIEKEKKKDRVRQTLQDIKSNIKRIKLLNIQG